MAGAVAQEKAAFNSGAGTTLSVTLDSPTTVGRVLHVITQYDTGAGISSSVSDASHGTYTEFGGTTNGTNERSDHRWIKVTSVVSTITLNTPNSNTARGIVVREISGVDGDTAPVSVHILIPSSIVTTQIPDTMVSGNKINPWKAFLSASASRASGTSTLVAGSDHTSGIAWLNGEGLTEHRAGVPRGLHEALFSPSALTSGDSFVAMAMFRETGEATGAPTFGTVYSTPVNTDTNGSGIVDLTGVTIPSGVKTLIVLVALNGTGSTIDTAIWDQGGVNEALTACGANIGTAGWGNSRIYLKNTPTPGASKTIRVTCTPAAAIQVVVTVVMLTEEVVQVSYNGNGTYNQTSPGQFTHSISGIACQVGDWIFSCRSDDLGADGAAPAANGLQYVHTTDGTRINQVSTGTGDSFGTASYQTAQSTSETITYNVDEGTGSGRAALSYVVLRDVANLPPPAPPIAAGVPLYLS